MSNASRVLQGSRYAAPRHEHLLRNVACPKPGYVWCLSVIVKEMIPMLKTALSFSLIFLAWAGQAADITGVPSTRVDGLAPVFSPIGRTQILTAESLLRVPSKDGKMMNGDLLVLYDTYTRRVMWRAESFRPGNPDDLILLGILKGNPSQAIFSSPDSMTWWRVDGTVLVVEVFNETARTLDEAFDRALAALNAGWEDSLRGNHPHRRTIDFADKATQEDFVHDKSSFVRPAYVDGEPDIVDIRRANDEYTITMRAQWIGETVIADDFQAKVRLHRVPDK